MSGLFSFKRSIKKAAAWLFAAASFMAAAAPAFAVNHHVSEEEFKSALRATNFTSSYRFEVSYSGQQMFGVNGYSENENDRAVYVFNLTLDDMISMALSGFIDERIDGRYSVKADNISGIYEAVYGNAGHDEVRKAFEDARILVKTPSRDAFIPLSEMREKLFSRIGSDMMNDGKDSDAGDFKASDMLDFAKFTFESDRYVRTVFDEDTGLSGKLSLSFDDAKLANVFFEGVVAVPDTDFVGFSGMSFSVKAQIRYSKVNATRISAD